MAEDSILEMIAADEDHVVEQVHQDGADGNGGADKDQDERQALPIRRDQGQIRSFGQKPTPWALCTRSVYSTPSSIVRWYSASAANIFGR
jgi:hypothetical protein